LELGESQDGARLIGDREHDARSIPASPTQTSVVVALIRSDFRDISES
jgi:hypothetical protein